ncbi:prp 4 CRoW domain-containing protein [Metarhizium album ARSEF 1941]|uniref:Prp 4 CRoW domain-containing protein n=1 Tax=Metarhizium album (strain ARSEF 1941) TaxID=1081103 RepID=A0A0B2WPU8_METAS|nr:prp 4 CRoW domain-containing protein [Metarhizium album ARSEF 1941]KHN98071.1 prp 4 CRoW domain-containing protein [Metarhizium album ARSEF 1941]
MLFQAVASVAFLAAGAAAVEARQPYYLAVMSLPGQSLMRRGDQAYGPQQQQCKQGGKDCREACGPQFDQCASGEPDTVFCFDRTKDNCCPDNSGKACAKGYFCARDTNGKTFCCPDSTDPKACAAALSVSGLAAATATPPPSTTSQAPTTSSIPPEPKTGTPVVTTSEKDTSSAPEPSIGKSTIWSAFNSTVSAHVPTQPPAGAPSATGALPSGALSPPGNVSAAATSGFSALLLVAAGIVALL